MKRFAIITSHPIQYNAPLFRKMAGIEEIFLKVFYTLGQGYSGNDAGFDRKIEWDIPLLEGYDFEFLENDSKNPRLGRFQGIRNRKILERINQFGPDVILVYGWNYASHLKVIRYFSGRVPIWFRGDSTLLDERPGVKQLIRRFFLRWVYKRVDKVLYVGEANKRYFQVHGIQEDQMVFIPHAVDNDHFYDAPEKQYEEKARQWRKELGIPDNSVVFLFAGKFIPKKDPLLLIKAFKQLYDSTHLRHHLRTTSAIREGYSGHANPPTSAKASVGRRIHLSSHLQIHLVLVGNGPLDSQLKKEAGDNPNIIFLPFQNQSKMPLVYRLGHVFVLPSKGPGETWGLAVNEVMGCSRPVIAGSKAGCTSDLIRSENNGYVFTSGDEADLKTIMEKMMNEDLEILGKRSREIIAEWSYESILDSIQQLLNTEK